MVPKALPCIAGTILELMFFRARYSACVGVCDVYVLRCVMCCVCVSNVVCCVVCVVLSMCLCLCPHIYLVYTFSWISVVLYGVYEFCLDHMCSLEEEDKLVGQDLFIKLHFG